MPKYTSLSDIQAALRAGETTCRAIVGHYLAQIEKTRHLNAYIEVWADEALAKADALDAHLGEAPTKMGRLCGAVISIKDNICYAGHQVTAASKILEGFTSLYSATAVERLLAEDAIIIGRTNCDQFGMGSSNENTIYGPVLNAADPSRVPGGSSGGAAVSVQTDTCLAALGSDTGGSVRQPAGFCGIWGFKPTYGRISRHGLIAYGSSFDQIGVLAHNPADIATLLKVMEGPDDFDATATEGKGREAETKPSALRPPPSTLKIAYFPEALDSEGMEAGVRNATLGFIEQLRAAGHAVEPVSFDLLDFIIPTYYVLTTAEASSNLARYDGIRYGRRSPAAKNLEETYLLSRSEGFSEEVKRRILLGTFVLSSGYYDAYYGKAQKARALIRQRIFAILSDFDFILMPVAPTTAWRFGEKSADPVAMYLSDIYTVLANLAGIPALAIPAGKHPENSLPVGVQLMAGMWEEGKLLDFAQKLRKVEGG
ncbi:MAG: Asp-tRNA(Asn)/Glu-tRNA(Gln) amidotransferase subunit GatA [Saprospiraceae bacterium]|nr:Asp-tRNA(Asn)/Glu-tRNA(Gln) amidotransferase subunit GatA [Saprospiraceae bacterium]